MNVWMYTARQARLRPGRTALTLFGIALGVALVVATRLTVPAVGTAYRQLYEGLAGRASLEITSQDRGGFDPEIAQALLAVPGVGGVIPRIQGEVSLVGKHGATAAPLVGIDPAQADVCAIRLREGAMAAAEGEAVSDVGLAEALEVKPGDALRIWAPAGAARLRLTGTLEPAGPTAALGGVLVVPLAAARRLFGLPGRVNSAEILLDDGADAANIQSIISGRLPPAVTVLPPGKQAEIARETCRAVEQGLAALSLLALTAAAFVILNTSLLNLGERRAQLAVLRVLGTTRGQVRRLLLGETFCSDLPGHCSAVAGASSWPRPCSACSASSSACPCPACTGPAARSPWPLYSDQGRRRPRSGCRPGSPADARRWTTCSRGAARRPVRRFAACPWRAWPSSWRERAWARPCARCGCRTGRNACSSRRPSPLHWPGPPW
jgi:ABC-type lipoprotein release transport system permease subunit